MRFRKKNDLLIGSNNDAKGHAVKAKLETPSEFIGYIIQYYTMNSDILAE